MNRLRRQSCLELQKIITRVVEAILQWAFYLSLFIFFTLDKVDMAKFCHMTMAIFCFYCWKIISIRYPKVIFIIHLLALTKANRQTLPEGVQMANILQYVLDFCQSKSNGLLIVSEFLTKEQIPLMSNTEVIYSFMAQKNAGKVRKEFFSFMM